MPNNKRKKYLVIAEIERTGFIADSKNKYWEAVALAKDLLLYGELFPWNEPEKIVAQLTSRGYKSYKIKGNQLYFDRGIYGSTDGKYSVMVVPIKRFQFCLESFIRERENYSIVFDSEVCWDKKRTDYFDNFPYSYHISN